MRRDDDWRLTNQADYLMGVARSRRAYSPANADSDHDHCEFCMAKFMVGGTNESLSKGSATVDRYRWKCQTCFDDFVDLLQWRVH
jgi:hypothetical protein